MSDPPTLNELLKQWNQDRTPPETLCRDFPELLPNLLRAIQALHDDLGTPRDACDPPDASSGIVNPANPVTLGRYRLEQCIGRGGFGEVWRAHDPVLDKKVAIKRPRSDRPLNEAKIDAFLKEARRAAALRHPAIVTVHNAERQGLVWFIVTDWIDGTSLSAFLTRQRLGPLDSARLVADIAGALHEAHRQGIVHRDVKPDNILLDRKMRPFLTDFGLAVTEDEQPEQRHIFAGTYAYMSPEQLRGDSHLLDGRSDIYSLGVVFYLLLTGRLPFKARTSTEYKEQALQREPRPPRTIDDAIPRTLEQICLKCLHKASAERYTTAADLAADLHAWLELPITEGAPTIEVAASRPARRRWRRGLGTMVGGVLLAGVLVVLALTKPWESSLPRAGQEPALPSKKIEGATANVARVRELVWPGHIELCSWKILPSSNALQVYADRFSLLQLGTTSDPDFELSLKFRQLNDTGSLGVFFGYRKDLASGRDHYELLQRAGKSLMRSRVSFSWDRRFDRHQPQPVSSATKVFDALPKQLTIVIRNRRLHNVLLDGSPLPSLLKKTEEADCTGAFGAYNYNSDGVYSEIRFNGTPLRLVAGNE